MTVTMNQEKKQAVNLKHCIQLDLGQKTHCGNEIYERIQRIQRINVIVDFIILRYIDTLTTSTGTLKPTDSKLEGLGYEKLEQLICDPKAY